MNPDDLKLAQALIPLLRDVVSTVLGVVNALKTHPGTPADAAAQLDAIALQLDDVASKVAAVQV